jgi:osmotically inducible lipoprotein OsmB
MNRRPRRHVAVALLLLLATAGCKSPYRADQGALLGGLMGAGAGAAIGDAAGGKAGPGAVVGTLTGAAVGAELDEIEAQNRAMIEQQLGRQVAAGAVDIGEVVAMSQAGVDEELIINHIRANGITRPLQTEDLIYLQQAAVSTRVIKAMQEPPPQPAAPVVIRQPAPAPVVVHEYTYGPPLWGPPSVPHRAYSRRRGDSGVSWGISFHN